MNSPSEYGYFEVLHVYKRMVEMLPNESTVGLWADNENSCRNLIFLRGKLMCLLNQVHDCYARVGNKSITNLPVTRK